MADFIINDENYRSQISPVLNGRPVQRGLRPRDYAQHPVGVYGSSVPFSTHLDLIPRENWPELCAEMKANKTRLSDIRNAGNFGSPIPALDQGNEGFCWVYSTTAGVQLLRAVGNMPYVKLSPHAVGCKIFDHVNRGAWGALSFDFIAENGVPSVEFWPEQSMSREHDNAATWENAKLHRILEGWIDIDVSHAADAELSFDQVATCLLSRIPIVCDFNWWGHSVLGMDLDDRKPHLKQQGLDDPNRWANRILNSWGDDYGENGTALLEGRKARPDGACAPRAVTTY